MLDVSTLCLNAISRDYPRIRRFKTARDIRRRPCHREAPIRQIQTSRRLRGHAYGGSYPVNEEEEHGQPSSAFWARTIVTDCGHVQQHLLSSEQKVDLLEGHLCRFGVEEPDQGDEAGVEDGKVDVGAVADGLD